MADSVQDWVRLVDDCYPERDAADWDATGLQVGDPGAAIDAVLVALDVTAAVLDEAVEAGAGLVLAHHPVLFRPLRRLVPDSAAGRLALRAAGEGVALLAAHTNFDVAARGTTAPVTDLLGLVDVRPLEAIADRGAETCKLVTFVPREDTARVLDALSGAGAGVIGEYSHCSFRVAGTGTFRPSSAADPAVGERGRLNEVAEDRLEVVLARRHLAAVAQALVQAHPYEEVAYDVYPLVDPIESVPAKGAGRIGHLPAPRRLREVADLLARGLPAPHLRLGGDPERRVRRVAACGGAGDGYVDAALAAGAELYVTGDLRHHVTLDALSSGMAMIDAGHYATEAAALPALVATLEAAARPRGLSGSLVASRVRTDPWGDYRPPVPADSDT